MAKRTKRFKFLICLLKPACKGIATIGKSPLVKRFSLYYSVNNKNKTNLEGIMKKLLTLTLALALMLTFVACGAQPAEQTSSSEAQTSQTGETLPQTQPQNIVLWHSMESEAGVALTKAVDDFNAGIGAEMQITVEAVFQGAYSDSATKMRTILQNDQADQLPDLMQIDATGIVSYMGTEYAFTVDDAMAMDTEYTTDDILSAPLAAWNYGGVQFGLPFSASTTILYYNKTMLDEAGVENAPTTFEEIIAAAENLPETNAAGQAVTAYAQVPNTPTMANWIGQLPGSEYDASYVVDNRNGRDASATKLVADEEGTLLTFLTQWKKMYDEGALMNSSEGLSELFLTQQIAFFTGSTASTVSLLEQIGGNFELGAAYLPRINDDANFGATVSGSGMFMFNKGDDAKAMAAFELLKYLTSASVQADFAAATGYTPVHTGAVDEAVYQDLTAQYPQMLIGIEQLGETSPDMMGVIVGPSYEFYMEISAQVSNMLTSGATPEDTVSVMTDSLNNLLEQYNEANA